MKNIFNKLGYISRPALIGTVLGVATVAVGIGIVTNFSGGASQPAKGFSGSALEQYAGDVSSQAQQQAAGYSKEDLEASMAAAEAQRNAASVYTLKDAAGKEQFAYNNSGVDSVNTDAVQSAGAGTVEGMGAGQNVSAPISGAADAKAAAEERAAKAAAGMGKAEDASQELAKAQLSTSKTMSGSSIGQGHGASASSRITQSLPRTADAKAGSSSIPQQAAAGLPNAKGNLPDTFKSGRAGELGGYNVKAQGEKAGGNGQAFFSTTVAELSNSARYSQAGKKTVYGDSGKGTALAQAAFDGSETAAEGVKIEGTNVQQGAAQALEGTANTLDMKPKFGTNGLQDVNVDIETFKDVRTQIWSQILQAFFVTLGAVFVIYAGVKAGGPWGWIAAIGAALVAGIAIARPAFLFDKLLSLPRLGGMNAQWTIALASLAMAVMVTAIVMAFISALAAKAALAKAAASNAALAGTGTGTAGATAATAAPSAGSQLGTTMASSLVSGGGNNLASGLTGGSGSSGGTSGSSGSSSGSSSGDSSNSSSGGTKNPYTKGTQEWTEWENSH